MMSVVAGALQRYLSGFDAPGEENIPSGGNVPSERGHSLGPGEGWSNSKGSAKRAEKGSFGHVGATAGTATATATAASSATAAFTPETSATACHSNADLPASVVCNAVINVRPVANVSTPISNVPKSLTALVPINMRTAKGEKGVLTHKMHLAIHEGGRLWSLISIASSLLSVRPISFPEMQELQMGNIVGGVVLKMPMSELPPVQRLDWTIRTMDSLKVSVEPLALFWATNYLISIFPSSISAMVADAVVDIVSCVLTNNR
jgi:hypothetical protein